MIVHKEDFYIIPRRWYKVNEVVVSINKMSTMNYATKFSSINHSTSENMTSQRSQNPSDGPILQFWWHIIPQAIMCMLDCLLVSAIMFLHVQSRKYERASWHLYSNNWQKQLRSNFFYRHRAAEFWSWYMKPCVHILLELRVVHLHMHCGRLDVADTGTMASNTNTNTKLTNYKIHVLWYIQTFCN